MMPRSLTQADYIRVSVLKVKELYNGISQMTQSEFTGRNSGGKKRLHADI